ncbi:MAG TPA: menaquinone biosynthesis decarboxylase [Egibacteraceae bacterium]
MSDAHRDLRSWIARLRDAGELVDVHAEVDPYLEISEIVDRTVKRGGPALLFHNVRGAEHPLLINQFGTERRMCMALGVDDLDEAGDRLAELMTMQQPFNVEARVRGMARMRRLADALPVPVEGPAPCQEIVAEPNLDLLPIQHCWPGDPAPFITLPLVITRDPRTGTRNVGIYRMQKIDARTTFLHWQIHKDAADDWRRTGDRLEVAVALGCDPVTTYMGAAPLPRGVDELTVAGLLRGAPVEVVRCRTIDVEVPASAEIVLEGYVERGDEGIEGPFGDHMGYYSLPEPFPVFHLTAMTMRRGAIYPSILVGVPPQEDAWLGKASERLMLPGLRMAVPELVDFDLPVAGAFQHCAIVSLRKAYPGHARKVMHALWGSGLLSLLKCVVVVDEDVDVHDYEQVFFHVCANVDPARDLVLTEGPLDQLDHAADRSSYGGKLGIDATRKLPAETNRPWPEPITMTREVRDLVDRRWDEYGIPLRDATSSSERERLPF